MATNIYSFRSVSFFSKQKNNFFAEMTRAKLVLRGHDRGERQSLHLDV